MHPSVVLILGKQSPPYIGPAVATQIILRSDLKERYRLVHLDTSDSRNIGSLGRLDMRNVFLALKQYSLILGLTIGHNPHLVYIPSQQTTIGYFRDIPFILTAKLFKKKVLCHLRGGNFRNWYDSCGRILKKYSGNTV